MTTKSDLEALLNKRQLWRAGDSHRQAFDDSLSTGFSNLDALLPQGGWPRNALVELLCADEGVGQIQLLIPALRMLTQRRRQWIAWINPPHMPYAPALNDAGVVLDHLLMIRTKDREESLWAAEQCIQSRACSAVLTWPGKGIPAKAVRRIQVACKSYGVWGLLFRSANEHVLPSPAPFRILLTSESHTIAEDGVIHRHLGIEVFKRAGGWAHPKITVPLDLGQPLEGIDQFNLSGQWPAIQSITMRDDEQAFEGPASDLAATASALPKVHTERHHELSKPLTSTTDRSEDASHRTPAQTLSSKVIRHSLKALGSTHQNPAPIQSVSQEIH
ncbi:MAG: translesion DNA synthesis-associated protein ImuA [Pseudomonadales bacterium]